MGGDFSSRLEVNLLDLWVLKGVCLLVFLGKSCNDFLILSGVSVYMRWKWFSLSVDLVWSDCCDVTLRYYWLLDLRIYGFLWFLALTFLGMSNKLSEFYNNLKF